MANASAHQTKPRTEPSPEPRRAGTCRFCAEPLTRTVVDLGTMPSANAYLTADRLSAMEPTWPLHVYICDNCHLVQLEALHTSEQLFSDYAYFSSYSDAWLRHAETYVQQMLERLGRDRLRLVIEVASNDGYLLQYFVRAGVKVLGIDPAANVAKVAEENGIPTMVRLFGRQTAAELAAKDTKGDLIICNNVLAHVPDINDFVAGLALAVRDDGIITVEFPHLLCLIRENQFDTIYHEHFSYLSLEVVERLFAEHGLVVFDVEELPTHGGSLRIFATPAHTGALPSERVVAVRDKERAAGLHRVESYQDFAQRVARVRRELVRTLIDIREGGQTIAAYGAPAKGNTLLNYCGVGTDLVAFTVDRSPHKQGHWLPGTRIPVFHPDKLREARPDYVLILPWNLKNEIMRNCSYIREWGGKFIIPIPQVSIVP